MDETRPESADTRVSQLVLPHGAKSTRAVDGHSRKFVKHDTHTSPHLTSDQYAYQPRLQVAGKGHEAQRASCCLQGTDYPPKDGEEAATTATADDYASST